MEVSRATCTRGSGGGTRNIIMSSAESAIALSSTSSSSGQTITSTTDLYRVLIARLC